MKCFTKRRYNLWQQARRTKSKNVYWAKINEWGEDPDGNKTVPAYGPSKHLPGAVSLSIDANGEAENFFADNGVYYVINNNAGYTGDLEIALITTEFATEILGEILDNNGVLVEKNDTELAQFALMFEFLGDKHHIRHVMYCCSASRPATESATTEESTEVKTEKLSLKATPLLPIHICQFLYFEQINRFSL